MYSGSKEFSQQCGGGGGGNETKLASCEQIWAKNRALSCKRFA